MKLSGNLTKPQLANLPEVYRTAPETFVPPKNIYAEYYHHFDWDGIKIYVAPRTGNLYISWDGKDWLVRNPEFFHASNVRHLKASMGFRVGISFRVHRHMEGNNCVLDCVAKLWFTEKSRNYFSKEKS